MIIKNYIFRIPVLFWNWPRTLVSLGNKHLIFFFDYIEINITIIKNMSKSLYDWSVFFSWNLRNTEICYRNSGMTNIKLKMFYMRYFIISVESENDKMSERGRRVMKWHSPLTLSFLTLIFWCYYASHQWKDLSVLLTPPIYIVLTTIWCPILVICHIYGF